MRCGTIARRWRTDPHSPVPYWGLGKTLSLQGKYGEAVKVMQQFKPANGFEPALLTAEIGYALGREGKTSEAQQEIAGAARGIEVGVR